jgi:hypothetical protein
MDLSTAPFWMALLVDGSLSWLDVALFVEGGYAVYVAEAIDRANPVLGQASDAWVVRLYDRGTYIPLEEALSIGLPDGKTAMERGVRALLEGGSFLGWVAERYGMDAAQEIRNGVPVEQVLGQPVAVIEAEWLDAVRSRVSNVRPCVEAVPEGSLLYGYCASMDGADQ